MNSSATIVFSRAFRRTSFKVGFVIVAALVLIAALATYIAPYPHESLGYVDPEVQARGCQPPSAEHLLGTDEKGRDLLSRILVATRVALLQSVLVVGLSLAIGIIVGTLAAYYKGVIEVVLSYFTELFMSIPTIVVAMLFRMTLDFGLHVVVGALVTVWWAWYARIAYVYAKSVVEMDYVLLAKLSGVGSFKILTRHVIRNIMQPMIVQAVSDMGSALLEASSINFLGLGLPPGSPDWGVVLYDGIAAYGIEVVRRAPWLCLAPGFLILVTVLGFSLVADCLREELDPKLRKKWRLWF